MTQEELEKLTPEERARLEKAEQKALHLLRYRMNEGARPRRHKQLACLVVLPIALIAIALIIAIVSWIESLFR